MDVNCWATAAVKRGMSIRGAAKKFGIPRSTLCDHIVVLNRTDPMDSKHKSLLKSDVDAVNCGRLSPSKAARIYGVPESTLRGRLKNAMGWSIVKPWSKKLKI